MTRTTSIALSGDAEQLVGVLERLRDGGFDLAELTVGTVSVKLHRAARGGADREDDEAPDPRQAIYRQFGGEMLERAIAEKLPGVDLQPAIGRNG
jgi:hypothetical protein